MSTSARKRPLRKCRNTRECDAIVDAVPGECEIAVETVSEIQHLVSPSLHQIKIHHLVRQRCLGEDKKNRTIGETEEKQEKTTSNREIR